MCAFTVMETQVDESVGICIPYMFIVQVVHDRGHMRTPDSKDSSRPDCLLHHKAPVYLMVQREAQHM